MSAVEEWLRERERDGEGSEEQRQVSDWQSWHLFTDGGLPLNPAVCWTLRVEMQGRAAGRSCRRDAQDAIGPFELLYFVLSVFKQNEDGLETRTVSVVPAEITHGSTGKATHIIVLILIYRCRQITLMI